MDRRAHFVEAFRWSPGSAADWVAVLGSAVGMAGPALAGAMLGNLPAGLAAAFGGMMIGGLNAGQDWRDQLGGLAGLLLPAVAASLVAALIAGHGWVTDLAVVGLAGLAAIFGGFSRPAAVATTRVLLLLIIALPVVERAHHRAGLLLLMLAGALWAGGAGLLLGAAARAWTSQPPMPPASPPPTLQQKFRRWRRSLTEFAGWHYALRLTACLAIAGALRWQWPEHHLHWIALTVALLCERQLQNFPVKTTQRGLGAIAGVIAAAVLLVAKPAAWALVIGIGLLAAARLVLRERNYLAYTAAMTPLIMIIIDAGAPPPAGLLADRLLATLIGAGLVIAANGVAARAAIRFT
jgi:Fusaric acid resistance protein-like